MTNLGHRAVNHEEIIESVKKWVERIVVGLRLCPFAERVFQGGLIRYVVSEATDEDSLKADLGRELDRLVQTPIEKTETTLIIHPHAFADFLDYNDFLDVADRVLKKRNLRGIIQVASFHPQYQFDGTEIDDVENFTNRSPYPMLHLLREESIDALDIDDRDLLEIPKRNIETLRRLGVDGIKQRMSGESAE